MAYRSSDSQGEKILSVGRALEDKGHMEAMEAITRALPSRPEWRARFILSATDREPPSVEALHRAARAAGGRVRIDANLPYAEVKAAWEKAAIGMVLTKSPEPFGPHGSGGSRQRLGAPHLGPWRSRRSLS